MEKISIESIPALALGIGTAIIIVAIIALITTSMIPSSYMTLTNNNYTVYHPTNVTQIPNGNLITLYTVAVFNTTAQTYAAVPATNYTYNSTNLTLQLLDTGLMNSPGRSVVFTYLASTNATAILSKGALALTSFADWFGILIVVVVAVIILGLIMFLRGRGGEA